MKQQRNCLANNLISLNNQRVNYKIKDYEYEV